MDEPLLKDFDLAAADTFVRIRDKLRSSVFLIYGHSMGAYLGLRVAGKLQSIGRPPAYLIVSGNAGPGMEDEDKKHLLGNEEFIKSLKELGGIPEEFIENRELIDFFMPILRADFEIAENNTMAGTRPIDTPIYAMMGSEEKKTDKIGNWGNFTTSTFDFSIMEGNHFFIFNHPAKIAAIIRGCYAKLGLHGQPKQMPCEK